MVSFYEYKIHFEFLRIEALTGNHFDTFYES